MITLNAGRLTFGFPEVHEKATCSISFQRTLRIPDDDRSYPLPPGLGDFPLRHIDDYARRLPDEWLRRGGVLLPMYQAEALWISFGGGFGGGFGGRFGGGYPFAIKIATGKICAVTGDSWAESLNRDPQDYLVVPDQPWLDGYCVGKGEVRQFVAMPLGEGYSVEEQLTGAAEHGGLQIMACPMKRERYEQLQESRGGLGSLADEMVVCCSPPPSMGLAPGGRMKQEIYDDEYGLDAWDQRHASRCFVSIVNSRQWHATTGEHPPTQPPTAAQYTAAGLPWFDFYSELEAVGATETLKGVSSVAAMGEKKGDSPLPENDSVAVDNIIELGAKRPARTGSQVREMS